MRIALLSDIHGNDIALAAVLTDIATQGPIDEYWILGDLLAIGAEPAAVYHRLQALNANQTVRYVRGNTDRFILSGDRPPPFLDEAYGDQQQTYVYGEVMANFAWTEGALAALNGRDFIASLPLSQRLDLPDGTRMLGVHCAQGDDAGFGFRPDSTDEQLRALYANHEADLIFMGHTHLPGQRHLDGVQLVNLGSVSNPLMPHLEATYVLLEAGPAGYQVTPRQVPYDREAVLSKINEVNHPCAEYLQAFFRGDISRRYWQGLVPIV